MKSWTYILQWNVLRRMQARCKKQMRYCGHIRFWYEDIHNKKPFGDRGGVFLIANVVKRLESNTGARWKNKRNVYVNFSIKCITYRYELPSFYYKEIILIHIVLNLQKKKQEGNARWQLRVFNISWKYVLVLEATQKKELKPRKRNILLL